MKWFLPLALLILYALLRIDIILLDRFRPG